jgi:hypothetical protein
MQPQEFPEAFNVVMFGKAPSSNGITNTVLKRLLQSAIMFLTFVLSAVLHRQHFPKLWKLTGVVTKLKPRKKLKSSSSYRPSSLIDTVGNIIEKILSTTSLLELNER